MSLILLQVTLFLFVTGCTPQVNVDADGSSGQIEVTLMPPAVAINPGHTHSFTATVTGTNNTAVAWNSRGGAVSGSGLTVSYTAPQTTGSYTLTVRSVADTTKSASASITVSDEIVTHGMAVPSGHPRLFYDATRLVQARTWYTSHPFTPSEWRGLQWASYALRGLLNNEPSQCNAAVAWARAFNPSTGPLQDNLRWYGQDIALIFDWCYSTFTVGERAAYISTWNEHFTRQMNYDWAATGGPSGSRSGPMGNYYWGVIRSLLLWALATYDENQATAETFLDNVLITRIADDWAPAAASTGVGGVGTDSSHYGQYVRHYSTIPFDAARLLGRDLYGESNFWKEGVYAVIYSTPAARSTQVHGGVSTASWDYFPFGDEEVWNTSSSNGGNQAQLQTFGDFMTIAATRWASTNTGAYASQWLSMVAPEVGYHVQSVTLSLPAPRAFSNLPLDFYASGPGYWFGHSSSDWAKGTTFAVNLGYGTVEGHVHDDFGNWQLWRGGRWLSRETTEYSQTIVGYNNGAATGVLTPPAHNSLLVNGVGPSHIPALNGSLPVVKRLESNDLYAFANVDLTATFSSNATHVERDFVFVRDLETLVIFDRIQSDTTTRTKTFLAHCESNWTGGANQQRICPSDSQELRLTTLVPASPKYAVVTEGQSYGQYRLEVDDAPNAALSYMLHVLQARAKSGGATALEPNVAISGNTYTVTLDSNHMITFVAGSESSGGTIKVSGSTTNLRSKVQPISVGDNGPVWQ
jgi:hypothetical protein